MSLVILILFVHRGRRVSRPLLPATLSQSRCVRNYPSTRIAASGFRYHHH